MIDRTTTLTARAELLLPLCASALPMALTIARRQRCIASGAVSGPASDSDSVVEVSPDGRRHFNVFEASPDVRHGSGEHPLTLKEREQRPL